MTNLKDVIIIYGIGTEGIRNFNFLKKFELQKKVIAFCDEGMNNIENIEDIPVVSYEEAKKLNTPFVVSILSNKKEIIECMRREKVPFYADMVEWIMDTFSDKDKLYYSCLCRVFDAGDDFNLFGNMREEMYHKLEPYLGGVRKIYGGWCPCCEKDTLFVAKDPWLRDHYKCVLCNSNPRRRAVMNVLNKVFPDWHSKTIHECSPSGPTMRLMKKKCASYSYSYCYDSIALGEILEENVTNQNIEKMTFADEMFDIYVTQDVFEHVLNPIAAFKEIERVLKKGGVHMFTVPLYPFIHTRARVRVVDGKVENILEPIYHKNPISKEGSLVTYDWGADIIDIIEKTTGMKTEIFDIKNSEESMYMGLEADFLQVLVSYKM